MAEEREVLAALADSPTAREVLELLRFRWARDYVTGMASDFAPWEAFCDHHGCDPENPTDTELVAFVQARAMAGAAWGTIHASLTAIRLALEGTARLEEAGPLTVPAQRHLSDLHGDGIFDPAVQAPVIPLGYVVAMVTAATSARDRLVVAVTYLAGLRPAEWVPIDLRHAAVERGGLSMQLPVTKTGRWQQVRVEPLPGTPFDVGALYGDYLAERGTDPGPLLVDAEGCRLPANTVKTVLRRAAAAAGVREFSPYSLRRSMAVHADLLGVPAPQIRARLRHRRGSQTYRRYIEPMLALMDRDGAQAHYLSLEAPANGPIRVVGLRTAATRLPDYAFAAGSLEQLLAGVHLPGLRVPQELATVSRGSLARGRAAFRRWAHWAAGQGFDPTNPPGSALSRYVLARLGEVDATTVAAELSAVRIGWIDATGRAELPGWATARTAAAAAAAQALASRAPRYHSRPSTPTEVDAVCATVAAGVPEPSAEWADLVLATATGARRTVEVVDLHPSGTTATVLVDGRRRVVLDRGPAGLECPVLAAATATAGVVAVTGTAAWADVWRAGRPHAEALRDRLAVTVLAGSGTRPSDLSRARSSGAQLAPGGLAVMLRGSKGRRPGALGRARLIWAPHRDGAADPVAAWQAWRSWWPHSGTGPLLPSYLLGGLARPGLTRAQISQLVHRALRSAGVEDMTAYGFRYGRAQEMHDAGETDETIAEALGHDDLATSRAYIQDFDPFADGLDGDFAQAVTR